MNGNDDENDDEDKGGSILTQRNLNALKMALEDSMMPSDARMGLKSGRSATAASVGKEHRATANAKITARKEKMIGGKEWK